MSGRPWRKIELMAGLNRDTPIPTEITLHQKSHLMEIAFSDGASFKLPYELLRVFSPSAEVRGHGPGQEVLQTGKRDVAILNVEPVGNYAIKPVFSDGHDSGIYSWELLYELGIDQENVWTQYLSRLAIKGLDRDAEMIKAAKPVSTTHACGKH